jgi:hypothetical protein
MDSTEPKGGILIPLFSFMTKIIRSPAIHHAGNEIPDRDNALTQTEHHSMNTRETPITIKYILAWFALPFIAIFNGVLRELTYSHMVGPHVAHQISSVLLSLFIAFYVIALNSKFTLKTTGEAMRVGLFWLIFTIVFETTFGILLGVPLSSQWKSYNIAAGNLWVLVLLSVFLSPLLFRRYRILGHA